MTDARDSARPTFPHLDNLERVLVADPEYLTRPVTVTEKIHGFNARVGVDPEGKLWVGTRSEAYYLDEAPTDKGSHSVPGLQGFVEYARGFHDLPVGMTVYGEWAGKGVQKGIDYGEKTFYVFAERMLDGPVASSRDVLDQHLHLGARTVPIISEGVALLDVLDELRRGGSVVAPGQPIEGVVIAPLEVVVDKYGHQVIAKFKSPAFQERASARDDKPRLDTGSVDAIAAEFVVGERLRHVLDQVAENFQQDDPLDVSHTGDVLRAMYRDVCEDAADEVEALSEDDRKLLGSAVNRATKPLLDAARLAQARAAVAS